jgi:hypothetical protein
MQVSRSASWRFRQADSQFLHLALFARDAAGLAIRPSVEIPLRLTWEFATYGVVIDAGQRAMAATQWVEWWGWLLACAVDDAKRSEDESGYEVMDRLRLMAERQTRAFDPPEFQSLASTPALQNAVIATFDEGLDYFNRSRPDAWHGTTAEFFGWEVVRNAAESVAAEQGVPLSDLRAVVYVLDVEGRWSYLAAPGCALCSTSLAADANAAGLLLHDVFVSASSQDLVLQGHFVIGQRGACGRDAATAR